MHFQIGDRVQIRKTARIDGKILREQLHLQPFGTIINVRWVDLEFQYLVLFKSGSYWLNCTNLELIPQLREKPIKKSRPKRYKRKPRRFPNSR
jgi:hypothetical protein